MYNVKKNSGSRKIIDSSTIISFRKQTVAAGIGMAAQFEYHPINLEIYNNNKPLFEIEFNFIHNKSNRSGWSKRNNKNKFIFTIKNLSRNETIESTSSLKLGEDENNEYHISFIATRKTDNIFIIYTIYFNGGED